MRHFWVNGIVAIRDKQPYVQLSTEKGIIAQLSMAEARTIAMDILQMAARTEADAMLRKFFDRQEYPQGAADALVVAFRNFRAELDDQAVEHDTRVSPEYNVKQILGGLRWYIEDATDEHMAWSGSNWVLHSQGIGVHVQVSNFATEAEARQYAREIFGN